MTGLGRRRARCRHCGWRTVSSCSNETFSSIVLVVKTKQSWQSKYGGNSPEPAPLPILYSELLNSIVIFWWQMSPVETEDTVCDIAVTCVQVGRRRLNIQTEMCFWPVYSVRAVRKHGDKKQHDLRVMTLLRYITMSVRQWMGVWCMRVTAERG